MSERGPGDVDERTIGLLRAICGPAIAQGVDKMYAVKVSGEVIVSESMLQMLSGDSAQSLAQRLRKVLSDVIPLDDLEVEFESIRELGEDDPRVRNVRANAKAALDMAIAEHSYSPSRHSH